MADNVAPFEKPKRIKKDIHASGVTKLKPSLVSGMYYFSNL